MLEVSATPPIRVAPLELARWSELGRDPRGTANANAVDTLLIATFVDERPLRGAAGLVDWRLLGVLSRLLRDGKIVGHRGEQTLLPGTRRLPMPRIIWCGLGPSRGYDETRFADDISQLRRVATTAGAQITAMQLPGRQLGLIGARRAMELLRDEMLFEGTAVVALEDPVGQRDAMDAPRGET